ncbi:hypothetical protein FOXYSP1_04598 [Fusarium oxysporum f. sp. phaseoli]
MIQAWYGSAKDWPLKWVAGRRWGPAEEQGSPAGLCAARFRL